MCLNSSGFFYYNKGDLYFSRIIRMRQNIVLLIGLVIILVVIGVIISYARNVSSKNAPASYSAHSSTTPTVSQMSSPLMMTVTPTSAVQNGTNITIQNMAFSPSSLTVKKGATVTWTNKDVVEHTVIADNGSSGGLNSAPLQNGQTYSFTFTQPGTYHYSCSIHPYMHGTIIVTS